VLLLIEDDKMSDRQPSQQTAWLRSRFGLALIGFLAIAAFFLVTEHRAHLYGFLPFLLLLLCPILHWLMHGSHDSHTSGHEQGSGGEKK